MSRAPRSVFDADYYRRFYESPRTRVTDVKAITRLTRFVLAYLDFLGIPPKTALDLGCGVGLWKEALTELAPHVRYTGVEHSDHVCEKHGWVKGSVVDYAGARADLVICQGVLHYLPDDDALAAIANLDRLAKKAVYLEILTEEDWEEVADRERTDGAAYLRPASFYQRALRERFVALGGGLFAPIERAPALFALERA
jgi:SAM-dependent methyltransferase